MKVALHCICPLKVAYVLSFETGLEKPEGSLSFNRGYSENFGPRTLETINWAKIGNLAGLVIKFPALSYVNIRQILKIKFLLVREFGLKLACPKLCVSLYMWHREDNSTYTEKFYSRSFMIAIYFQLGILFSRTV